MGRQTKLGHVGLETIGANRGDRAMLERPLHQRMTDLAPTSQ